MKTRFPHRLWLVLVGCILLSGCTLRLAYHFLDWGLQWKLEHYLDLNGEQRKMAKAAIARFHQWHQQQELPRYLTFLQESRARLDYGDYTLEQIRQQNQRVQGYVTASVLQITPDFVDLLASLSDKQVSQLDKTLAEDREDYAKERLKPSIKVQREHLANDLKEFLENYLGKLTAEQNTWLMTWSQNLQLFGPSVLAEQQRWAQQLNAALAQRQDRQALLPRLQALLLYSYADWQPPNRALAEANETLTFELFARIANSLSEKQRNHLRDILDTYISDCQKLIAETRAASR